MKILFIGSKTGNSYLQYLALKKLHKDTDIIDSNYIFSSPMIKKIFYHISPYIFEFFINFYVLKNIKKKYDLIYVRSGEIIGKKLIINLKKLTKKIVFFCNDNPFVKRDKRRWDLFLGAAKYYDKIAFQDKSRISVSKKYGVKNPLLVLPAYDEKIHQKRKISLLEKKKFQNDVVFIGTWSPKKGSFIKSIIHLGLNIKIYGNRWGNDPNYNLIKKNIIVGHISNPNYTKIIQCSKIALCLFSEENKDTITARSVEIPAIGTLLCSLRTKAMKKIFVENKEAIYFTTPKECVNKCKYYLKNKKKTLLIAKRGNIKITKKLNSTHTNLIKKILKSIDIV